LVIYFRPNGEVNDAEIEKADRFRGHLLAALGGFFCNCPGPHAVESALLARHECDGLRLEYEMRTRSKRAD